MRINAVVLKFPTFGHQQRYETSLQFATWNEDKTVFTPDLLQGRRRATILITLVDFIQLNLGFQYLLFLYISLFGWVEKFVLSWMGYVSDCFILHSNGLESDFVLFDSTKLLNVVGDSDS